jgi:AAA15 family ATPase/GTPase
MIQEIQLSNFKAFADTVTIPIKPITLIFGPNSSGKSSIIQSLLLLKQTIDDAENPEPTLIAKGSLVDLGSYGEFVHRHNLQTPISFKITAKRPSDLVDTLPYEDYLSNMHNIHPDFDTLNTIGDFNTIGLGVTFSYESSNSVNISKLELYLGDDAAPLFTYENSEPDEKDPKSVHFHYQNSPKSIFKIKKVNVNHPYWYSYREAFNISESDLPTGAEIQKEEDEMTDEQKELLRREVEKWFKRAADDKGLLQQFLEIDYLRTFRDIIELRNFLPNPNMLNGDETQYIIFDDNERTGHKRRISFFTLAISSIFRKFLKNTTYIGPLRDYPERYFTFTGSKTKYVGKTGSHVADILIRDKEVLAKVNEKFNSLQIGYQLEVRSIKDEPSGIHDLYFLRLRPKSSGVLVGITDVGFGISQVLPIIVQSMTAKEKTMIIEQPELHLHPAHQAELGDLFVNAALGEQKNTFIIETHSEHLILRLLRRIRETTEGELPQGCTPITPDQISVLYVEPGKDGSKVISLQVTEDGDFENRWPNGFFTEREKELF